MQEAKKFLKAIPLCREISLIFWHYNITSY